MAFFIMGLFSSSKTYVAAYTASLIEDTPDLLASSIATSILKSRDIAPDIVGNYLNGIYINSKRYYTYARDSYVYGLPDGSAGGIKAKEYLITPHINEETGEKTRIVISVIDRCDGNYFAFPWMKVNRGWDSETNIVDHTFYDDEGNPIPGPIYFVNAEATATNQITIEYTSGIVETFSQAGVNPANYYYHVIYRFLGDTEEFYWNYDESTGVYPDLDIDASTLLDSPYYPVVPIRENNVDLTEDTDSEFYKTAKYLLNIIDLDIDELAEGVNENPDIDDIDHAYVITGIDLSSDKEQSKVYLFDYFNYLWGLNPYTKSRYDKYVELRDSSGITQSPPEVEVITIKDANYHIDMCYNFIDSQTKTGVIGSVGEVTSEAVIKSPLTINSYSVEQSEVIFRKQIDATTYRELTVGGLKHINYIADGYTIDTTIAESFERDEDDEQVNSNFVVPLNYSVVNAMGIIPATELMYDSIKMVFNSIETVKLKWYQTGFFQFVTIAIAVAVTIITYQPGALTQSILGASATAGLSTIALVMSDIVLSFAVKETFALVAEVVPSEVAFAFSIIAASYAVGSVLATGSVAGMPFASEALFVSNGLTEAVQTAELESLSADIAAFEEYTEAQYEQLDENWEDLQPQKDLDPLDLFTSMGEATYFQTPGDYIYKSIHAGNIGVTTVESAHTYVENTLTLPSLSNSLGVNINV